VAPHLGASKPRNARLNARPNDRKRRGPLRPKIFQFNLACRFMGRLVNDIRPSHALSVPHKMITNPRLSQLSINEVGGNPVNSAPHLVYNALRFLVTHGVPSALSQRFADNPSNWIAFV